MSNWKIAGTPLHQGGSLFPESDPGSGLGFRKNAAKLAWYNIDPLFHHRSELLPPNITPDELSNHFVRNVYQTEIWPHAYVPDGRPKDARILNTVYYPNERGPYNYDATPTSYSMGMASEGTLLDPASRWSGITCNIDEHIRQLPNMDNPDEWTIDFILMDPFVYDPNHSGGDMYIQLGLISEDVLRDGRTSVESGLPTSAHITGVDTTIWGRIPNTTAAPPDFNKNPASRPFQDVGLEGLNNEDERQFFNDSFLQVIANLYGTSSEAYQNAYQDPSADDFQYFRSTEFDLSNGSILERYRRYNGLDGNSPTVEQTNENYPVSATQRPDREDFSEPGILQETEKYFQYKISLRPEDMAYSQNYIIDIHDATHIPLANGDVGDIKWYYFSIPIQSPDREIIGGAPSVSDYRFIRIIYKNFEQTIVCRFPAFQIVVDEENRPVFDYPGYPLS
ncbi:MAG: cell surface protein SprA [Bacteroidales bacterium]|nr:cell surface protein SprA [Bacteroidales bacterium]